MDRADDAQVWVTQQSWQLGCWGSPQPLLGAKPRFPGFAWGVASRQHCSEEIGTEMSHHSDSTLIPVSQTLLGYVCPSPLSRAAGCRKCPLNNKKKKKNNLEKHREIKSQHPLVHYALLLLLVHVVYGLHSHLVHHISFHTPSSLLEAGAANGKW